MLPTATYALPHSSRRHLTRIWRRKRVGYAMHGVTSAVRLAATPVPVLMSAACRPSLAWCSLWVPKLHCQMFETPIHRVVSAKGELGRGGTERDCVEGLMRA
jgi:hypothetical protein